MSGNLVAGGQHDVATAPAIVVSTATRGLRRQLRPVAWMVLEEVALDAAIEQGRLVARTSARRVAEQLGIDPGSAAGALRLLRDRGLVTMEREAGLAGRFGLAVYVLGNLDGVTILAPGAAGPSMAEPSVGEPSTAMPCVAGPEGRKGNQADRAANTPATAPPVVRPKTADDQRRRSPFTLLPAVEGQTELDLGLGTA